MVTFSRRCISVLKEHKGHMSENIRSHLFKASNVVITCSSSGKLTTSLVEYWRDHVLLPSLGPTEEISTHLGLLGRTDRRKGVIRSHFRSTRLEEPKKTTDQIQPLDVFFNRQMKVIPRRLFEHLLLDELDIKH